MRSILEGLFRLIYLITCGPFQKKHTFSRFKMYESIIKESRSIKFLGPVLSISHSDKLAIMIGRDVSEIVKGNYPDVNISNLPYADNSFNLVVSDQVFEHIDDLPSTAMKESLRVCKPGGWVLHTTCFCTAYHGPGDFWRFTAEGLKSLALRCGASVAISKTDGHPVELIFNYIGWTRYGVPTMKFHPLNILCRLNRPSYGSTVWVLAQKPA